MKKQQLTHPKFLPLSLMEGGYNRIAFTLVELIVVITILAILWTIAFISLQWYSSQSRDSVRISDISSMKTWLELFNLDAGKYPLPTNETIITYSWATVWTQWYFWDQTARNVSKLDKIPTDPLNDQKYVYSTTNTRQEFQIAWVMEWDEISFSPVASSPLISGELREVFLWEGIAQASAKTARIKISWTYNGKVLKVNTWSTTYVLAVPSIITSSWFTLETITTNNLLAYNGYKNIPYQYSGIYNLQWETGLNLVNSSKLVVFSWDISTLSNSTSSWILARKTLIQNLQLAYTWTTIKNIWEISTILLTDTNDTSTTEILSTTLVSNNLWWSVVSSSWWWVGWLDTSWCAYGSTSFTNALWWTNTELKYDSGTDKCYVFWDEDANAQNACNKWITDNVTLWWSWIWTPARNFVTDWNGTNLKDTFYQREVTYNSHTYVCRWFAVMKYEAKFTSTTWKTQPNPTDWATWTTSDYTTDNDTFPETINSGITSKATDNPVAYIRQWEAIDACKWSTSNQYHLITNNEWMAVARNIEAQTVNLKDWNKLYRWIDWWNGQNGEDWTLWCGKIWWQTTYRTAPAWTDNNSLSSNRSTCDDMRQNKLSNWALVWDISWNVWEQVNKSNVPGTSNDRTTNSWWNSNTDRLSNACWWNTFYSFYGNDWVAQCTYQNGYTYANMWPLTTNLNASNGIWRIYSFNTASNIFLRGGGGAHGTYSGLFTLYLGWYAANRDGGVGFRCSW